MLLNNLSYSLLIWKVYQNQIIKSSWSDYSTVNSMRHICSCNNNDSVLELLGCIFETLVLLHAINFCQELIQNRYMVILWWLFSLCGNRVNFIKENNAWGNLSCIFKNLSDFLLRLTYIFVKYFWALDWYEVHLRFCGQCFGKHGFGAARWAI